MRTIFGIKAVQTLINLQNVRRLVEAKLSSGEVFNNINFGKVVESVGVDLEEIGNNYFSFLYEVKSAMLDLA